MAVLPIVKLGHPALRKRAAPVERFDHELRELAENLIDTMRQNDGIGLAGPQVNVLKRIFVIDLALIDESLVAKAYVNPVIQRSSEDQETYEEGCLSIPRVVADVIRSEAVEVTYQTLEGIAVEERLNDVIARVFQHEYDHLDGTLFIDHLPLLTRKKLEPELNRIREANSIS